MSTSHIWLILTDVIGLASIAVAALFVGLALKQWISRRHFRAIDRELRWALLPAGLVAATYFFFEKVWVVHTRPPESGAPLEPSFPSTHTLVAATIFFMTIIILPRYVHSRRLRLVLDLVMLAATVLIAVGRVLAHMHWPSDVVGGLLFAALFAAIYALILRRPHAHPTQHPPKPQTPTKSHNRSQPEIIQPED